MTMLSTIPFRPSFQIQFDSLTLSSSTFCTYMLERNSGNDRPALCFPVVAPHTYAHLMWVSNPFLELTRVGPNPVLESYSYCDLAASGNRTAIANTLLSCRATTTKPDGIPPGLFARYLAGRVGRSKPLSPRLQHMVGCIHAIERIGKDELNVSGPEAIRLLSCLNADVGDIVHICEWTGFLVSAIRSPAAMETLSSHCWCVLGKSVKLATQSLECFESRDVEVMCLPRKLETGKSWRPGWGLYGGTIRRPN